MGLKLEEIKCKDIKAIQSLVKVLTYLNTGRELKIGDYTYRVAETNGEGFSLVFKMKVYSSGETIEQAREEWMGYQGSIDYFSKLCNTLTNEDFAIMSANMTLSKINKRNGMS